MELVVSSLDLVRNGRLVQADLSFQAVKGTALILRGPNGVGKTSLLRALAGLLPVASGQVTLDGHTLAADRDAYSETVALSGHLDAVKPQLTVTETLRYWSALHGGASGDDGEIDNIIEDYALTGLADRLAGRLSAGQRRRLGLARLPLTGTKLWLMDEPANSLDQDSTQRLGARIDQHLALGGLAVIATHIEIPLSQSKTLTLSRPAPRDQLDPFVDDGAFA